MPIAAHTRDRAVNEFHMYSINFVCVPQRLKVNSQHSRLHSTAHHSAMPDPELRRETESTHDSRHVQSIRFRIRLPSIEIDYFGEARTNHQSGVVHWGRSLGCSRERHAQHRAPFSSR